MSVIINLRPIPNQSLSIVVDSFIYNLELKVVSDLMVVTITRDNLLIISGMHIVSGSPLIPYRYLEEGNFIFISNNNEIPFYTQFGITQNLIYFTKKELSIIRNGS